VAGDPADVFDLIVTSGGKIVQTIGADAPKLPQRWRSGQKTESASTSTDLRLKEALPDLLDGNLGAPWARMRQALDARIDHSTDRLEEFNPRIRQVLLYSG
jgi:hypothetical protein